MRVHEKARRLARCAHTGQVDKAGQPYYYHTARVAAHVEGDEAKAVAYLHDVLEDTLVTREELAWDVPENVVEAVVALTRRDGESYSAYLKRVKANPLARQVKIADLVDNLNLGRLPGSPTKEDVARAEKYVRALKKLIED